MPDSAEEKNQKTDLRGRVIAPPNGSMQNYAALKQRLQPRKNRYIWYGIYIGFAMMMAGVVVYSQFSTDNTSTSVLNNTAAPVSNNTATSVSNLTTFWLEGIPGRDGETMCAAAASLDVTNKSDQDIGPFSISAQFLNTTFKTVLGTGGLVDFNGIPAGHSKHYTVYSMTGNRFCGSTDGPLAVSLHIKVGENDVDLGQHPIGDQLVEHNSGMDQP